MKKTRNLHTLLRFIAARQDAEPDYAEQPKRPDPPVSGILRRLDNAFGLSLGAVGWIISSGNTIPHDEVMEGMLEWAKGSNSEFEKSHYFPRLQALLRVAEAMSGHFGLDGRLERALTGPLPASLDEDQRSVAYYIQADDFAAIDQIIERLGEAYRI